MKPVLIAAFVLIFSNLNVSAKRLRIEINLDDGKNGNCQKYVQNSEDQILFINHIRALGFDPNPSNPTERKDSKDLLFLMAVTTKKQMMSSQIEYRYLEGAMDMFKYMNPSVLASQNFEPKRHLNIADFKYFIDDESIQFYNSSSDCISEGYPNNLIADHGIYAMRAGRNLDRIYFEPDGVGEYISFPKNA
uniref:Astacin domain-containing protein n=1 Tax=Caenorhabditis tropicalis TaxID=1561998 RepID=A0A1I7UWC5_9PELO